MFKPINNRILVRPDEKEKEKTTASGIIITESVEKNEPVTGTVLAGKGEIETGSRISYSKYGFDAVEVENEILHAVSIPTIIGIY